MLYIRVAHSRYNLLFEQCIRVYVNHIVHLNVLNLYLLHFLKSMKYVFLVPEWTSMANTK